MTTKQPLAIIIPAHNEQTVIARTLDSLKSAISPEDIYMVDDCSTDETVTIAKTFTKNVLALKQNLGKATALNSCIKHFELTENYDYILPIDADTCITPAFISSVLKVYQKDTKKQIAAVIGRVVGQNHSWITSFRIWEYEIAQSIHKNAQDKIGAVIVCPGCATVYRSDLFTNIEFPTGTLTEDMDLTFMIHRNRLGKIVFNSQAKVITQDPGTLKDYGKQLYRWYTGFWQCVQKHHIPWGGQILDFEVAMLSLEGLLNSLLVTTLILALPIILLNAPIYILWVLSLDLGLFMMPTLIFSAWRQSSWNILRHIPQFYFLRIFSSVIFLLSFIKVVAGADLLMGWNKPRRYSLRKEGSLDGITFSPSE